ncbi:hypothetical protein PPROV_000121200 [Pycnococcus provasolii]|uniref:Dynamin GTPase n=2 Tax=Pycnococcus provasolii TaxID=41880 RepID=A0A830H5X1_9CHLO|nr:hypothetical protein PPROV_000121200 [Pycnococcus provasolii]
MSLGETGLLKLVNKLQASCTLLGDTGSGDSADGAAGGVDLPSLWEALPSIVVVGGQSSGKSSVLEAVVGHDFLPRGSGIVTRRPLLLQLIQTTSAAEEYGTFLHKKNQKFHDYEQIRREIDAETHRSLGKYSISSDPINLTIRSPSVPNLTLVDLPGLTKVAVEGQPASIVRDIENMARQFIQGKNAIILAVTPANADAATSDALRLAKEVDPAGERTIGVLTKLDIMDRGTDAHLILTNRNATLKHGWIGIVNRSQADIDGKKNLASARRAEMEFFTSHPAYRGLHNVGTPALSKKLSTFLEKTIRDQIPHIQNFVLEGIQALQAELRSLGGPAMASRGEMLHMVLTLCREFDRAYETLLDRGKNGGESILGVFESGLKDSIHKQNFKGIFSLANVATTINEADGYQPHLIAPEMGYRRLIEQGLGLLRAPCERCVDDIHQLLCGMVQRVVGESVPMLNSFRVLKTEVLSASLNTLDKLKEEAKAMVVTMVEMEKSYLTAEFFRNLEATEAAAGGAPAAAAAPAGEAAQSSSTAAGISSDFEEKHLRRIGAHCSAYVKSVVMQMRQTVPKACVYCQVQASRGSLLEALTTKVASAAVDSVSSIHSNKEKDYLARLLEEDESVARRRDACARRLELLNNARDDIAAAL